MLSSSRKLGRASSTRDLLIRKEFLNNPGYSRLAHMNFGGNETSWETFRSQRKDVFLLSRGDGVHDEL